MTSITRARSKINPLDAMKSLTISESLKPAQVYFTQVRQVLWQQLRLLLLPGLPHDLSCLPGPGVGAGEAAAAT